MASRLHICCCLVAAACALLLASSATAFLLPAPAASGRAATIMMAEKGSNSGVARRHAIGQALGRLALAAGVGSWAAGTRPMGGLLPANAETTAVKKVSASKVRETPNGVKYVDIAKGEGLTPKQGDFVVITYTGYLPDGTIFDSLHSKGKKPLAFKIGTKQVIPGLEEALASMQPGGERQILVPAELAYGEKGVCLPDTKECLVPPNSPVKFDLILKRVAVSPI